MKSSSKSSFYNEFVKCNICGNSIPKGELKKHSKFCGNPIKEAANANKPSKPKKNENTFFNENVVIELYKSDCLDGAPNSYVFRENGKYGSHSSYDDMSDESVS